MAFFFHLPLFTCRFDNELTASFAICRRSRPISTNWQWHLTPFNDQMWNLANKYDLVDGHILTATTKPSAAVATMKQLSKIIKKAAAAEVTKSKDLSNELVRRSHQRKWKQPCEHTNEHRDRYSQIERHMDGRTDRLADRHMDNSMCVLFLHLAYTTASRKLICQTITRHGKTILSPVVVAAHWGQVYNILWNNLISKNFSNWLMSNWNL